MNYFDFFTRPQHHFSTIRYGNRLVAEAPEEEGEITAKYQSLFSDAFGHHVQFNLDVPAEICIQLNNKRRFVENDSLSSYFLDKLYTPPVIFQSQNTNPREADKRSFNYFLQSISDSPVTRKSPDGDTEGSNLVSFLVGDIGAGKTLLLCKAIRDLKRKHREVASSNPTSTVLLPVYFDFENEMRSNEGKLLDVDDKFFGRLCTAITRSVTLNNYARDKITVPFPAADVPFPDCLTRLITVVRQLMRDGVRLMLVLDNLDGYHYHYSKYAFFPQHHKAQLSSIQRNIMQLTSALTHGEQLGMLGLCIVLAARRYVYQECLHTRTPETSAEYSGAVFQLGESSESEVIQSRMKLFREAIIALEKEPKLKTVGEDYRKTLGRLSVLFGLEEASDFQSPQAGTRTAIRTLRQLCHHGNRDLVAFLSNLRLDHRQESELIERFFLNKPHTLVLLYLADLKERYTQKHGHFPNLFLVDALVLREPDFADAHLPHVHTYWLKYLILSYVAAQPDAMADTSHLIRIFVGAGGFDEKLVQLVLGSLSMTRESRCLEPEPGEKSIPARVAATARGRYLMSRWEEYKTPFAFSFTYLQLIVDDYLMSYPSTIWKEIYRTDTSLEYLFADMPTYARDLVPYLRKKVHAVLAFVHLLRISLSIERSYRPELFKILDAQERVVPDMDAVEKSLWMQFDRIFSATPTARRMIVNEANEYRNKLSHNTAVREQLESYFQSNVLIEA